jgi:hypothetical protein
MARSLWLALALTFLAPCIALAQARPRTQAHDDELTLTLETSTSDDLASIDAESHAATGLYVAAVALHVGGLGMVVGGGIAGFCISFTAGACASAAEAAQPWVISGLIMSAVGLLMFIPAIILDVDSGHRRDRMRGHVAFTVGAGGVGIQGSF